MYSTTPCHFEPSLSPRASLAFSFLVFYFFLFFFFFSPFPLWGFPFPFPFPTASQVDSLLPHLSPAKSTPITPLPIWPLIC